MAFRNISSAFLIFIVTQVLIAGGLNKSKQWVYFTDKGPSFPSTGVLSKMSFAYQEAIASLDPRALARRAKMFSSDSLVDVADLPIYEQYLDCIKSIGGELIHQVRWINAASFMLSPDEINLVEKLPFVSKVKPVIAFKLSKEPKSSSLENCFQKSLMMDYGPSTAQLQIINVPPLHSLGITGRNVLIGILDSGFRWRVHEALQSRHVIAEHDFIFHDDVTSNQPGDSADQDAHGTLTFSILGGYKPGKLIGPAYDADFILGKTEYVPAEYRGEEDNWAAGIEWMESKGVDVVSSSVGYNIFDDGTGYFWTNGDFNGRTSVVAQAAVRAARLGVVVCTSMGNEGIGDGNTGTLLTPADADSIISVGAITRSRMLANFSSTGPTNDHRIKPEVVALGVGVYHASIPGPNTYGASDGNSVSTPLVAGTAALLLSARPELTPIEVRNTLCNTAELVDTLNYPHHPNNFIGWGLVNAFKSAISLGPIFSNEPEISIESREMHITIKVISSFGLKQDSVVLNYAIGSTANYQQMTMTLDSSMYYPTSGQYSVNIPAHIVGTPIRFYIEAHDSGGHSYTSPPRVQERDWWIHYGIPLLQSPLVEESTLKLYQNYPNPFYSTLSFPSGWISGGVTIIQFELPKDDRIIMKVYNLLGEEVAIIADGFYSKGIHSVVWNAENNPSGVYLCRISNATGTSMKKMLYIR